MSGYLEYIVFNFSAENIVHNHYVILDAVKSSLDKVGLKLIHNKTEIGREGRDDLLLDIWNHGSTTTSGINFSVNISDEFYFTVGIDPQNSRQSFMFIADYYISGKLSLHMNNIDSFVDYSTSLFESLSPAYGFGLVSPNIYPFTTQDDGLSSIRAVFDLNYFGADLVRKIGKELLSSIPSYETRYFANGGIFVRLTRNPLADTEPDKDKYRMAAELLGVSKIYRGG